jgi:hypothetical protein
VHRDNLSDFRVNSSPLNICTRQFQDRQKFHVTFCGINRANPQTSLTPSASGRPLLICTRLLAIPQPAIVVPNKKMGGGMRKSALLYLTSASPAARPSPPAIRKK